MAFTSTLLRESYAFSLCEITHKSVFGIKKFGETGVNVHRKHPLTRCPRELSMDRVTYPPPPPSFLPVSSILDMFAVYSLTRLQETKVIQDDKVISTEREKASTEAVVLFDLVSRVDRSMTCNIGG